MLGGVIRCEAVLNNVGFFGHYQFGFSGIYGRNYSFYSYSRVKSIMKNEYDAPNNLMNDYIEEAYSRGDEKKLLFEDVRTILLSQVPLHTVEEYGHKYLSGYALKQWKQMVLDANAVVNMKALEVAKDMKSPILPDLPEVVEFPDWITALETLFHAAASFQQEEKAFAIPTSNSLSLYKHLMKYRKEKLGLMKSENIKPRSQVSSLPPILIDNNEKTPKEKGFPAKIIERFGEELDEEGRKVLIEKAKDISPDEWYDIFTHCMDHQLIDDLKWQDQQRNNFINHEKIRLEQKKKQIQDKFRKFIISWAVHASRNGVDISMGSRRYLDNELLDRKVDEISEVFGDDDDEDYQFDEYINLMKYVDMAIDKANTSYVSVSKLGDFSVYEEKNVSSKQKPNISKLLFAIISNGGEFLPTVEQVKQRELDLLNNKWKQVQLKQKQYEDQLEETRALKSQNVAIMIEEIENTPLKSHPHWNEEKYEKILKKCGLFDDFNKFMTNFENTYNQKFFDYNEVVNSKVDIGNDWKRIFEGKKGGFNNSTELKFNLICISCFKEEFEEKLLSLIKKTLSGDDFRPKSDVYDKIGDLVEEYAKKIRIDEDGDEGVQTNSDNVKFRIWTRELIETWGRSLEKEYDLDVIPSYINTKFDVDLKDLVQIFTDYALDIPIYRLKMLLKVTHEGKELEEGQVRYILNYMGHRSGQVPDSFFTIEDMKFKEKLHRKLLKKYQNSRRSMVALIDKYLEKFDDENRYSFQVFLRSLRDLLTKSIANHYHIDDDDPKFLANAKNFIRENNLICNEPEDMNRRKTIEGPQLVQLISILTDKRLIYSDLEEGVLKSGIEVDMDEWKESTEIGDLYEEYIMSIENFCGSRLEGMQLDVVLAWTKFAHVNILQFILANNTNFSYNRKKLFNNSDMIGLIGEFMAEFRASDCAFGMEEFDMEGYDMVLSYASERYLGDECSVKDEGALEVEETRGLKEVAYEIFKIPLEVRGDGRGGVDAVIDAFDRQYDLVKDVVKGEYYFTSLMGRKFYLGTSRDCEAIEHSIRSLGINTEVLFAKKEDDKVQKSERTPNPQEIHDALVGRGEAQIIPMDQELHSLNVSESTTGSGLVDLLSTGKYNEDECKFTYGSPHDIKESVALKNEVESANESCNIQTQSIIEKHEEAISNSSIEIDNLCTNRDTNSTNISRTLKEIERIRKQIEERINPDIEIVDNAPQVNYTDPDTFLKNIAWENIAKTGFGGESIDLNNKKMAKSLHVDLLCENFLPLKFKKYLVENGYVSSLALKRKAVSGIQPRIDSDWLFDEPTQLNHSKRQPSSDDWEDLSHGGDLWMLKESCGIGGEYGEEMCRQRRYEEGRCDELIREFDLKSLNEERVRTIFVDGKNRTTMLEDEMVKGMMDPEQFDEFSKKKEVCMRIIQGLVPFVRRGSLQEYRLALAVFENYPLHPLDLIDYNNPESYATFISLVSTDCRIENGDYCGLSDYTKIPGANELIQPIRKIHQTILLNESNNFALAAVEFIQSYQEKDENANVMSKEELLKQFGQFLSTLDSINFANVVNELHSMSDDELIQMTKSCAEIALNPSIPEDLRDFAKCSLEFYLSPTLLGSEARSAKIRSSIPFVPLYGENAAQIESMRLQLENKDSHIFQAIHYLANHHVDSSISKPPILSLLEKVDSSKLQQLEEAFSSGRIDRLDCLLNAIGAYECDEDYKQIISHLNHASQKVDELTQTLVSTCENIGASGGDSVVSSSLPLSIPKSNTRIFYNIEDKISYYNKIIEFQLKSMDELMSERDWLVERYGYERARGVIMGELLERVRNGVKARTYSPLVIEYFGRIVEAGDDERAVTELLQEFYLKNVPVKFDNDQYDIEESIRLSFYYIKFRIFTRRVESEKDRMLENIGDSSVNLQFYSLFKRMKNITNDQNYNMTVGNKDLEKKIRNDMEFENDDDDDAIGRMDSGLIYKRPMIEGSLAGELTAGYFSYSYCFKDYEFRETEFCKLVAERICRYNDDVLYQMVVDSGTNYVDVDGVRLNMYYSLNTDMMHEKGESKHGKYWYSYRDANGVKLEMIDIQTFNAVYSNGKTLNNYLKWQWNLTERVSVWKDMFEALFIKTDKNIFKVSHPYIRLSMIRNKDFSVQILDKWDISLAMEMNTEDLVIVETRGSNRPKKNDKGQILRYAVKIGDFPDGKYLVDGSNNYIFNYGDLYYTRNGDLLGTIEEDYQPPELIRDYDIRREQLIVDELFFKNALDPIDESSFFGNFSRHLQNVLSTATTVKDNPLDTSIEITRLYPIYHPKIGRITHFIAPNGRRFHVDPANGHLCIKYGPYLISRFFPLEIEKIPIITDENDMIIDEDDERLIRKQEEEMMIRGDNDDEVEMGDWKEVYEDIEGRKYVWDSDGLCLMLMVEKCDGDRGQDGVFGEIVNNPYLYDEYYVDETYERELLGLNGKCRVSELLKVKKRLEDNREEQWNRWNCDEYWWFFWRAGIRRFSLNNHELIEDYECGVQYREKNGIMKQSNHYYIDPFCRAGERRIYVDHRDEPIYFDSNGNRFFYNANGRRIFYDKYNMPIVADLNGNRIYGDMKNMGRHYDEHGVALIPRLSKSGHCLYSMSNGDGKYILDVNGERVMVNEDLMPYDVNTGSIVNFSATGHRIHEDLEGRFIVDSNGLILHLKDGDDRPYDKYGNAIEFDGRGCAVFHDEHGRLYKFDRDGKILRNNENDDIDGNFEKENNFGLGIYYSKRGTRILRENERIYTYRGGERVELDQFENLVEYDSNGIPLRKTPYGHVIRRSSSGDDKNIGSWYFKDFITDDIYYLENDGDGSDGLIRNPNGSIARFTSNGLRILIDKDKKYPYNRYVIDRTKNRYYLAPDENIARDKLGRPLKIAPSGHRIFETKKGKNFIITNEDLTIMDEMDLYNPDSNDPIPKNKELIIFVDEFGLPLQSLKEPHSLLENTKTPIYTESKSFSKYIIDEYSMKKIYLDSKNEPIYLDENNNRVSYTRDHQLIRRNEDGSEFVKIGDRDVALDEDRNPIFLNVYGDRTITPAVGTRYHIDHQKTDGYNKYILTSNNEKIYLDDDMEPIFLDERGRRYFYFTNGIKGYCDEEDGRYYIFEDGDEEKMVYLDEENVPIYLDGEGRRQMVSHEGKRVYFDENGDPYQLDIDKNGNRVKTRLMPDSYTRCTDYDECGMKIELDDRGERVHYSIDGRRIYFMLDIPYVIDDFNGCRIPLDNEMRPKDGILTLNGLYIPHSDIIDYEGCKYYIMRVSGDEKRYIILSIDEKGDIKSIVANSNSSVKFQLERIINEKKNMITNENFGISDFFKVIRYGVGDEGLIGNERHRWFMEEYWARSEFEERPRILVATGGSVIPPTPLLFFFGKDSRFPVYGDERSKSYFKDNYDNICEIYVDDMKGVGVRIIMSPKGKYDSPEDCELDEDFVFRKFIGMFPPEEARKVAESIMDSDPESAIMDGKDLDPGIYHWKDLDEDFYEDLGIAKKPEEDDDDDEDDKFDPKKVECNVLLDKLKDDPDIKNMISDHAKRLVYEKSTKYKSKKSNYKKKCNIYVDYRGNEYVEVVMMMGVRMVVAMPRWGVDEFYLSEKDRRCLMYNLENVRKVNEKLDRMEMEGRVDGFGKDEIRVLEQVSDSVYEVDLELYRRLRESLKSDRVRMDDEERKIGMWKMDLVEEEMDFILDRVREDGDKDLSSAVALTKEDILVQAKYELRNYLENDYRSVSFFCNRRPMPLSTVPELKSMIFEHDYIESPVSSTKFLSPKEKRELYERGFDTGDDFDSGLHEIYNYRKIDPLPSLGSNWMLSEPDSPGILHWREIESTSSNEPFLIFKIDPDTFEFDGMIYQVERACILSLETGSIFFSEKQIEAFYSDPKFSHSITKLGPQVDYATSPEILEKKSLKNFQKIRDLHSPNQPYTLDEDFMQEIFDQNVETYNHTTIKPVQPLIRQRIFKIPSNLLTSLKSVRWPLSQNKPQNLLSWKSNSKSKNNNLNPIPSLAQQKEGIDYIETDALEHLDIFNNRYFHTLELYNDYFKNGIPNHFLTIEKDPSDWIDDSDFL